MATPVNSLPLDPDDFPAYAVIRGNIAVFDPDVGWWRWADTGKLSGDPDWQGEPWTAAGCVLHRPIFGDRYPVRFPTPFPPSRGCAECGLLPTSNGHDPCIADLPGIVAACCGHGGRSTAYRMTAEDVERRRQELKEAGLLDE